MKVGVVPTKYGYSAVCLGPFDDGKWEIASAKRISEEHLLQLRSQIAHKLAEWCRLFTPWRYALPIAIPWATWGAIVLGMYYVTMFNYGPKYIVLYGWIRLFFFGDGIRVLTQTLYHLPGVLKSRRVAKQLLTGTWEPLKGLTLLPRLSSTSGETETEYIWCGMKYCPDAIPFYEAMLEERPPAIFDWHPLGMVGWLRVFFLGPKFRFPVMVFEMGLLEDET